MKRGNSKSSAWLLYLSCVFFCCNSSRQLPGTYCYGNSNLIITEQPNNFEYIGGGGEMGKLHYTKGSWMHAGKRLILSGFDDSTLRQLTVNYNISYNNNIIDSVVIKRQVKSQFAKVEMIINNSLAKEILSDTSFTLGMPVKEITLKSYLYHPGILLSYQPGIDTLSRKIVMDNTKANRHFIQLNIIVGQYDFNRELLRDTITILNSNKLQWDEMRLNRCNKVTH